MPSSRRPRRGCIPALQLCVFALQIDEKIKSGAGGGVTFDDADHYGENDRDCGT